MSDDFTYFPLNLVEWDNGNALNADLFFSHAENEIAIPNSEGDIEESTTIESIFMTCLNPYLTKVIYKGVKHD